jgi:hypothetical protein
MYFWGITPRWTTPGICTLEEANIGHDTTFFWCSWGQLNICLEMCTSPEFFYSRHLVGWNTPGVFQHL